MSRNLSIRVWGLCLALGACGGDDAADPQNDGGGAPVDAGPQSSRDSGSDADGDGAVVADAGATASGPLLPWKQGNTWTYKVTGDGEVSEKVTTVGALEPVGGSGPHARKMAFKVVTKKGATDQTVSWQALEGERVVRYREQALHAGTGELEAEEHWDPAKLHLDMSAAHTVRGATWLEVYQETKTPAVGAPVTAEARDPWTVDAVDQEVIVPAGRFRAIVLTKSGGSSMKKYWYVPGVGKVKETGGQTEELVRYEVTP